MGTDERHYFHAAVQIARERERHLFTNQFENLANSQAHYESTAPELWDETLGAIDGFVCSCGTGGSISGVASRLKELKPDVQCWVIDPPASGLMPLIQQGHSYEIA